LTHDDGEALGDTVGKGSLGGADPGSGIPITTGPGDTGDAAPGVSNKTSNSTIEQETIDTDENDEKGNI
jgi:hypothetical protein